MKVLELDAHLPPELRPEGPPLAGPRDALEGLQLDSRERVRREDVVCEADGGAPGREGGDEEEGRGRRRGRGGRRGGSAAAAAASSPPAPSAPDALGRSPLCLRCSLSSGVAVAFFFFFFLFFSFFLSVQNALERPGEHRSGDGDGGRCSFSSSFAPSSSSSDELGVPRGERPGDEGRSQVAYVGGRQRVRVTGGGEAGAEGLEESRERAAC